MSTTVRPAGVAAGAAGAAPQAPPSPSGTRRLTAVLVGSLPEHRALVGDLPLPELAALIALLEAAGLTGRGGAGFPTARKLVAVAAAASAGRGRRGPVVVGNAMEGEWLSHKDRLLLQRAPHLVLDGLEVLAHALGATRRVVAVGERTDPAAVRSAAAERSGPPIEVADLGGGFIGGQESAVVRQLDGGPAVPSDPHTPVWRRGVAGRPTLVVNAETLAHVALLVRRGAAWFRSVGPEADPGTFLASISGSSAAVVSSPGVFEVARGTSLSAALLAAGADLERTRAVLVGGYHGAWLDRSELDVALSREGLLPYGAAVGAGVLLVLDTGDCPLEAAAEITTYLAAQSAGQCGPCRNGLPRMADTLQRLAVPGADPRLLGEVERLRGLVLGRGACAHPDGTARLVASTMRVFAGHATDHLGGGCR